jgi:hypothetical protein
MSEDWLGNDLNVYRFDQVPPESERIAAFAPGLMLRAAVNRSRRAARRSVVVGGRAPRRLITPSRRGCWMKAGGWWRSSIPRRLPGSVRLRPGRPGEVIYDPRLLELAEGIDALPPGTYTVSVQVYRWTPAGIIDIPTTEGDQAAVIGTLAR